MNTASATDRTSFDTRIVRVDSIFQSDAMEQCLGFWSRSSPGPTSQGSGLGALKDQLISANEREAVYGT